MRAKFKILYQNQDHPDMLVEEINYFQLDGRDNYLYMKAKDETRYKSTKSIEDNDYLFMADILLNNNIIDFIDNNTIPHIMFTITEDDEEDYSESEYIEEKPVIDSTASEAV